MNQTVTQILEHAINACITVTARIRWNQTVYETMENALQVWFVEHFIIRSGMTHLYYFSIFNNYYCKRRHQTKTHMPREGHQDWHGGTTVCGKRSQAGRHLQCFSSCGRAEGPREACASSGENIWQQLPWSARRHGPRVVRRGDKRKRWSFYIEHRIQNYSKIGRGILDYISVGDGQYSFRSRKPS